MGVPVQRAQQDRRGLPARRRLDRARRRRPGRQHPHRLGRPHRRLGDPPRRRRPRHPLPHHARRPASRRRARSPSARAAASRGALPAGAARHEPPRRRAGAPAATAPPARALRRPRRRSAERAAGARSAGAVLSVTANERLGAYRVLSVADPDGPAPARAVRDARRRRALGRGEDERPFLPRAFSIARQPAASAHFLLEDVGPGTRRLCELRAGRGAVGARAARRAASRAPRRGPARAARRRRRGHRAACHPAGRAGGQQRRHRAARLPRRRARRGRARCWRTRGSPPTTARSATTALVTDLLERRARARRRRRRLRLRARRRCSRRCGATVRARAACPRSSRSRQAWPAASGPASAVSCPARRRLPARVRRRARARRRELDAVARARRSAGVSVGSAASSWPTRSSTARAPSTRSPPGAPSASSSHERFPFAAFVSKTITLRRAPATRRRGCGRPRRADQLDRPAQQGPRAAICEDDLPALRRALGAGAADHQRDGLDRRGARASCVDACDAAPRDRRASSSTSPARTCRPALTSAPTRAAASGSWRRVRARHHQAADRQAHAQHRRRRRPAPRPPRPAGADAVSLINTLRAMALAPGPHPARAVAGRRHRRAVRARRPRRRARPGRRRRRAGVDPRRRHGRRPERAPRPRAARCRRHARRRRHRELPRPAAGTRSPHALRMSLALADGSPSAESRGSVAIARCVPRSDTTKTPANRR